jgi:ApaG protein
MQNPDCGSFTPLRHNGAMPSHQFSCQTDPRYLPEESTPEEGLYVFAYTITLQNTGEVAAQLISRHWDIEDAHGQTQVVDGLGVVGHQPLLQPGESFRYSSSARLRTPMGLMSGHYFCVGVDGHRFEVPVAPFVLKVDGPAGGTHLH